VICQLSTGFDAVPQLIRFFLTICSCWWRWKMGRLQKLWHVYGNYSGDDEKPQPVPVRLYTVYR